MLISHLVYLFIGAITIGNGWWLVYLAGAVQILVGIGYVALEFIPSIEPPANMRYSLEEANVSPR